MASGDKWTEEEVELLRQCYKNKMLMPDMLPLFNGRTPKAIQKKADTLGLQKKYKKFPNIDYSKRHHWTQEEFDQLEEEYKNNTPISIIAEKMGLSERQIISKASDLGLGTKYIKKNNPKYKAVYQSYDWCFERYVNQGMTHEEMAKEAGCSVRVMKKWCNEIHSIHGNSFRSLKTLNDLQRQVILFGTLGDGHISKREDEPIYIESHCESEKDYLFWKYDVLKDLCNNPPTYYPAKLFGSDSDYLCEPFYRMNTRIIDELKEIRAIPRIDKIRMLNELGFCLHILDDGSRANLWQICLAEWSQEEMNTYEEICWSRLGLNCHQLKDNRYYLFDAISSKKIDDLILRTLPTDLDIIHKKIIDNSKIKELCHYRYVITNNGKYGLANYCSRIHHPGKYEEIRDRYDLICNGKNEIGEADLINAIGDIVNEI